VNRPVSQALFLTRFLLRGAVMSRAVPHRCNAGESRADVRTGGAAERFFAKTSSSYLRADIVYPHTGNIIGTVKNVRRG